MYVRIGSQPGCARFYFASVEDFWRSLKRVVGSWLRLYARWRSSAAGFFSFMNDEDPFFSVWVSSDKRGEHGRVWTSFWLIDFPDFLSEKDSSYLIVHRYRIVLFFKSWCKEIRWKFFDVTSYIYDS